MFKGHISGTSIYDDSISDAFEVEIGFQNSVIDANIFYMKTTFLGHRV